MQVYFYKVLSFVAHGNDTKTITQYIFTMQFNIFTSNQNETFSNLDGILFVNLRCYCLHGGTVGKMNQMNVMCFQDILNASPASHEDLFF